MYIVLFWWILKAKKWHSNQFRFPIPNWSVEKKNYQIERHKSWFAIVVVQGVWSYTISCNNKLKLSINEWMLFLSCKNHFTKNNHTNERRGATSHSHVTSTASETCNTRINTLTCSKLSASCGWPIAWCRWWPWTPNAIILKVKQWKLSFFFWWIIHFFCCLDEAI